MLVAVGCNWLQLVAVGCIFKFVLFLAAVGCIWLQLVAFGCKVKKRGCSWLQISGNFRKCSQLQPKNVFWLQLVAMQPTAANCSHGCKMVAVGCSWLQLVAFFWLQCNQLQPQKCGCSWLQLAAFGCSWLHNF